ncbi:hypothetical protein [Streptomyces sp. NPDC058751]|uniref:hypothetical protein n=1 Tax=Streptomyces sp. NPDC058751 TaxID=3346623 RepID=UPI00367F43CD
MSTERPDNDATDPVGGHAEGPAEDTAGGTVEDPPEGGTATDAADVTDAAGTVADTPEGAVPGSGEEADGSSGGDTDGATGEDAAEGSVGGSVGDSPEPPGSPEDTDGAAPEGSREDEDEAGDSGEGAVESAVEGAPEGSGEDEAGDSGGVGGGSGGESRDEHPEVAVVGSGAGHGEGAGADGARRRRTPVLVASVAAAVLLAGGGGAYFAATAAGGGRSGTPGADGTPPPLALEGYAASTSGDDATGSTAGIAPGEPDPYGTTYRASGTLPSGPGSAHVRWAEGTVTRAEVARLAKALGLAGTPRLSGDSWTVGTAGDGSEPNLRVTADAPGTWTYASALPGGDNCVKVTRCAPARSGFSAADSAPGPVSEAAAEKAAAPVLKAVGQDDAKLDASQLMDRVRVVNADPVMGGLPTYGWTTGLRIGTDGRVVGGSGRLKAPVEGDAYPVVGARKTLDLMNGSAKADRRMGIGGCASPVPLKDRDETPCEHPSAKPEPEAATVEKAVFGLAAQRADGRQVLVPSWLFEVRSPGARDTYTVTRPAVDPAFLASPESPAPPSADPAVPVPSGEPSSPAATRDVGVQGYTAKGRDLTVSFTGGVCAHYSVSVSESSGRVTVTVTEKPWKNKVCIMIAKIYEKTVRLDEPLGGREVVGSDGRAVHHGHFGVPETSAATPPTSAATPPGPR